MKKLTFLILVLVIGFPGLAPGQTSVDGPNAKIFNDIPQEEVFVHYNTALIFSGEYLYYKIYNLSKSTGLLSGLSKIAYVELLGEDGTQIFKHKIRLIKGTGQGDFFLPTTVPSGNYKLVAYTRWMLNQEQNFFSGDVAIVNPYRGDQRAITPSQEELEGGTGSTMISSGKGQLEQTDKNRQLQLDLNSNKFAKREQVLLKLSSPAGNGAGNYSVSVKKLENYDHLPMTNVSHMVNSPEDPSAEKNNTSNIYLPELRGELLTGKIQPKAAGINLPLNNRKISLSIPGEDYMVKIAGTNARGEFFFNLNGEYSGDDALLEIIGDDKDRYNIEIAAIPSIDNSLLEYNKFYLTPAMEEKILERSVYNQIENAYYSVKPDTLPVAEKRIPFYEDLPIVYDLDDFTRFPSIRETFIEIIKDAAVRNNRLVVRGFENAVAYNLPSLLIVDGVVVQDHAQFIDIPSTEVQSIAVLRNNYFLGPQMFQGVVDVTTINENFDERYSPAYLEKYDLEKPRPEKNYFKQSYTEEINENIPDFRHQLFWLPELEMNKEEVELGFYTSEITGEFEVILQGVTAQGNPVYIRKSFRVE